MKTWRTRYKKALAALAGAAGLVLAGCNSGGAGGPPPDMAIAVEIGKPEVRAVEETLAAMGTVEANERVEIKPKASGIVTGIHFKEGERVRQGQKLFSLDSQEERAVLVQARAEEELARLNLARMEGLEGTKAVSRKEIDQLESELAVRTAAKQVREEKFSEREIVAPFAGIVGRRAVSPGQYIDAGTALATLVDHGVVKVYAQVPEHELGRLRVGMEGRLHVSAYEKAFSGTVDLIDLEVDEATRTATVRLAAANDEGLLRPGMFARVELVVDKRTGALVIPEAALIPSLSGFSVYRVQEGVARLHPIKVGVRLRGQAEVLDGLSAGDPIVVSGTQKLVDGMKVEGIEARAVETGG